MRKSVSPCETARLQRRPWALEVLLSHQLASSIVARPRADSMTTTLRLVSARLDRSLHAFSPWHNPGRARQAISRRFELGAVLALPCEHLACIRSRL